MNIGRLDKRITIQTLVAAQDAFGAPGAAWTMVATVWAELKDLTGREFLAAAAVQNMVQTKITIRYPGNAIIITPKMRVVHGADIYNIEAVLGQDKVMRVLMCSKGVNNG
jgi:SPP1 family predicted phage head-tail adaptor